MQNRWAIGVENSTAHKKVLPPYIWTRWIVYVSYAFVQMYSQPHVIDYEKRYFLLGIIKLKAKENTVMWPRPYY